MPLPKQLKYTHMFRRKTFQKLKARLKVWRYNIEYICLLFVYFNNFDKKNKGYNNFDEGYIDKKATIFNTCSG